MHDKKEDLLRKADEFERMAELACSEALRGRYRSMARYRSILAGQAEQEQTMRDRQLTKESKTFSDAAYDGCERFIFCEGSSA